MRPRIVIASLVVLAAVVVLTVAVTSGGSGRTGLTGSGREFLATADLGRPVTGVVDVDVSLRRHDGAATDGVEAVLVFGVMPAMGHLTPEIPARRVGPDRFRVHGELFSMPGMWELNIRVESTDGPDVIGIEVPVERGG